MTPPQSQFIIAITNYENLSGVTDVDIFTRYCFLDEIICDADEEDIMFETIYLNN